MKNRSDILLKDTWNVDALFSLSTWKEALDEVKQKVDAGLEDITVLLGEIKDPVKLKKLLDNYFDISLQIEKLFTYSHLRFDEDTKNEEHKISYNRAMALYFQFKNITSSIEPEILQVDEAILDQWIKHPELALYQWFLKRLKDQKKHVLDKHQENLLSLSGLAMQTASKAFSALNNADIKFKEIKDKKRKSHELSHGLYQVYLKSNDRVLRSHAFTTLHHTFIDHENVLTELLGGHIQSQLYVAKARKFSTCLESALFPNQIPPTVYHQLIDTVGENIHVLHRYVSMRKKWMKYKEIHAYDLYAPIVADIDYHIEYTEAANKIVESLGDLGKEYQSTLQKGLLKDRWVDIYENTNKRSGAYSSGCYGSMPYILMNFHGTFSDLMTLSHEAGHSMHSFYSNKTQAYPYASYSIFLAEIASTFHEELTFQLLYAQAASKKEKIFLLNQKIDGMRATFFRQTMFAEFELLLYSMGEQSIPLTPQVLKEKYVQLNAKYFGADFTIDEVLGAEFLRIPHFYYGFYVYQYATGIAAAHEFAKKVIHEKGKDAYIKFISAGSSKYPVDVLKEVGIDVTQKKIFVHFIDEFNDLVNELDKLLS
ncbi:MAG: oligoendopeptidase F [Chlamydiales bacterium]|nr:oligoendopeptidase F [Chlamydiales bacterium]